MAATRLTASFDGQVAYLTLDNPPLNVIDFPMIAEIKAFLGSLRSEPRLCAVMLQARGRAFSAGVDVGAHLPETVHAMIDEFHGVFTLLDELAVPTLALVRGACLGGACELVGYVDCVLATDQARFGLPEIKLGVFPPVAAALFPQRFAYQKACQLLLSGDVVDAEAAAAMGLVSRLVSEAQSVDALEEAVRPYRERSASSLRAIKTAMLRSRGAPFRQLVAASEQVYFDQLMATSDAVEGLRAFLEKRDPVWSHA